MTTLRWFGILVGLFVFLFMFNLFRHNRVRRNDFFWGTLFSFGIIIVSVYPNSVNLLRDMLALAPDQFSRLADGLGAGGAGGDDG